MWLLKKSVLYFISNLTSKSISAYVRTDCIFSLSRYYVCMKNMYKLAAIVGGVIIVIWVWIWFFLSRPGEFSLQPISILSSRHAQREPIEIPVLPTDVYIWSGILNGSTWIDQHEIRSEVIKQLVAQWFSGFITVPYPTSWYNALTASGVGVTYVVNTILSWNDDLDLFLSGMDFDTLKELKISRGKRSTRSHIQLFRNTKDLENLWYTVVSHRTRINKDEAYRRTNISQAFKLLSYVRIILPGEQFEFLKNAQYDGKEQKNYLNGYAIIENDEIKVYGGGICGASTAIYQWTVTNKSLQPTKLRSHSKWFTSLYTATINWQLVKNPWIDAAIYEGVLDFHVKNISTHPIIIVMNYDGSYGWLEQIFSLGYTGDLGSIEYVGGYRTSMVVPDDSPLPEQAEIAAVAADSFDSDWIRNGGDDSTGDNNEQTANQLPTTDPTTPPPAGDTSISAAPEERTKTIYGGCYTRLINWEKKQSCYREVK